MGPFFSLKIQSIFLLNMSWLQVDAFLCEIFFSTPHTVVGVFTRGFIAIARKKETILRAALPQKDFYADAAEPLHRFCLCALCGHLKFLRL
jgi:hypothetical protein